MKNYSRTKIVLIIIVIGFWIWVFYKMKKDENEIEKYKVESVCYVYNFETRRSFEHILVYYYYNGIKYETIENVDEAAPTYLKKYYKIIFSSKDPTKSKVIYNCEIKDSLKIKNAGF